ncbi:MAG TPA: cobyrinate a,c-diamide synthase [Candidatus Dormibacteraeota bacterium]|nr:cobyrinate a,c-diamide synthase [Candidatus Dormibacteraeota bacterium]
MSSGFDQVVTPRLVLAGAGSTTGKTTLTAAVIAALRRRGTRVSPFKVGPDFVDAAYLAHVAGRACRNLDPWILGEDAILQSFAGGCIDTDIAIIEGIRGLFDSWGAGPEGSTAELSRLVDAPVVLAIDVSGMVQSAAAIALGFKTVDPRIRIAGVILNRVESDEHARWIEEAVWQLAKVPVLGWLPEIEELVIPEDERGLTPVAQNPGFDNRVGHLADAAERHLDIDLLLRVAANSKPLTRIPRVETPAVDRAVRLGVAYDEAFSLYYPENLEILAEAGAEIVPFSLLHDSHVPDVSGLYLAGASAGGFAPRLAENTRMLESVREAHLDGMPIYGECGGLMYMAEKFIGEDGSEYPMAGLLPITMSAHGQPRRMGYREVQVVGDNLLARAGERIRGHEMHWSRTTNGTGGTDRAYELFDASGVRLGHEGFARPALLASDIHLHFAHNRELAHRFLEHCLKPVAEPLPAEASG